MPKLLKNSLTTPLTIQLAGHVPAIIPGGGVTAFTGGRPSPSLVRITDAHYAALMALDVNDPRRVALSQVEVVADNGSFPID